MKFHSCFVGKIKKVLFKNHRLYTQALVFLHLGVFVLWILILVKFNFIRVYFPIMMSLSELIAQTIVLHYNNFFLMSQQKLKDLSSVHLFKHVLPANRYDSWLAHVMVVFDKHSEILKYVVTKNAMAKVCHLHNTEFHKHEKAVILMNR